MIIKMLTILFSLTLDLLAIIKVTDGDKDLEIAILRQQVRILQRKAKTTPRITDPERMVLATLTDKFKRAKTGVHQRLNQVILIFKPETVLRWQSFPRTTGDRELVRRKWTYKRKGKPGRPGITAEVEALIVRLAKENASWGYERIQGELFKLGHTVCPSTVRNVLKRYGITPASERSSSSWRKFLGHYKDQMLACDFFHRGDQSFPRIIGDWSQNHLRSVLHRTGDPTRPSGRLYTEPQHNLGYPTSSSTDLGTGGRISRQNLPHPRQRQEVPLIFRYDLYFERDRNCKNPVSSSSGEKLPPLHRGCIRGTLGTLRSRRVSRSYLNRKRAASAPSSPGVHRLLHPGSPTSGHLPAISHFRSKAEYRGASSQAQHPWRYYS